jgi:hypothetical protein
MRVAQQRSVTSILICDVTRKIERGPTFPVDIVKSAVSDFDACCRDISMQIVNRIPMKLARRTELQRLIFQDIESPTIAMLKSMFDIDLLRGMEGELAFAKMMMHRRHIYEHNAGVADERYVRESGDKDANVGILLRESKENAHRYVSVLARIIGNFDVDFHEIFQPTEWPINNERARQERRRAQDSERHAG